jgi:hypothetical protein
MNDILAPMLCKNVLVFMDDILIYSQTFQQHAQHLEAVLGVLHQQELEVKKSKCTFAQQEITYLGHLISPAGVSADKKKITPIVQWKQPSNVNELRRFLGMTWYYSKFIKGYGIISRTLTDLLKKGVPYVWNSDREATFQALKQALITTPVLALPDFTQTFVIEMDASSRVIRLKRIYNF